jgi:hypothetical protein
MSNHLIGTSYSLPHGCNKHCSVITCYYILSVHFLPIPSVSDAILPSIKFDDRTTTLPHYSPLLYFPHYQVLL